MNPKHMGNDNSQHPGSYKCVFACYGIKHTVSVTSLHISLVYSSTFIKV